MEERRSSGRSKRPAKPLEDGSWDCSVCTYKNSPEAYKCEMCDVRKGTSTRKPKINPQLIAQQVAQQYATPLTPPPASPTNDIDQDAEEPIVDPIPVLSVPDLFGPPPPPKPVVKKEKGSVLPSKSEKSHPQPKINKLNKSVKNRNRSSMMKHVDRNSARQMSVTVDNVTVVITDYQPKKRKTVSDIGINSTLSDASDSSSNASNDIHSDIPHSGNLT